METLAVVAYLQPVTRADVADVRGVSSEWALTSLEERGLVEQQGRADTPGRAAPLRAPASAFSSCSGLRHRRAAAARGVRARSAADVEEIRARLLANAQRRRA